MPLEDSKQINKDVPNHPFVIIVMDRITLVRRQSGDGRGGGSKSSPGVRVSISKSPKYRIEFGAGVGGFTVPLIVIAFCIYYILR